ncbi:Nucleotide-binding alpha-beta plait [Penicillium cf. griseofulvum]|uniref:Nucleotide-binding alpha-beta plait n=1 Tax=Penicillium cf. griseofulvum TaxID=2972120 RepID=A0A9W9MD97_9EURO|nr:Nucleotide-binding alpha-beta plait [Penicillium cf. griseofulvum]KAJ5443191.1 Nucleotide-binding alpha-beta plait [Penicillium cf. griseofulvum]KAJ5451355.1 Nucleotide-binding alpha-beta plait [Penicillium cf. griseofulvum]
MSVDALADSVAATTLTDKPDTNGATPSTQAADAAAASADEGRRLYIGNLAYATTEEELKEFFKTYTIETTSIPVNPRTNRPVGYAFVDIATAAEAAAAIQALSGKEILQRKVSVQLARKPEPAEAKEGAASGGEGSEGRKRAGGRGRGRGRARGRGGRTGRSRAVCAQSLSLLESAHIDTLKWMLTLPKAQDGQEATTEAVGETPLAETTNDKDTASKTSETRAARPQKQRGPPEDGIPSKTKVMVANLPYDLTEDKLKEIFAAYEPVSAKVALRPIPRFMIKKLQARNERRKTRGFGFVNLASEELQAKAVSEMNGKDIDGRVIAVKVAIDSPGKEDEDINAVAETEETAAPAAAAPAPAQENAAPAVTTKA